MKLFQMVSICEFLSAKTPSLQIIRIDISDLKKQQTYSYIVVNENVSPLILVSCIIAVLRHPTTKLGKAFP